MQLSNGFMSYIIDIEKITDVNNFWSYIYELLNDRRINKVGYGLKSDCDIINKHINSYSDYKVEKFSIFNVTDLDQICKKKIDYKGGLKGLCSYFNFDICKYEQVGNWNLRPLRGSQIHYGVVDAFICVLL